MANTKITSRVLADNAVLTANITDANVTTAKVADNAVTGDKVADDVALAGNPTTTTQSAGNNTTRIATTAFVSTAVANLADSAPDALNTLNELAAAMGDDANFSTTITNSIAAKLPLAGGTMTGDLLVKPSASGATATSNTVGTFESNDNTEVSILGGSSSVLALNFGHSGDNDEGLLSFNTTSGSEDMILQSTKDITLRTTSTNSTAGDINFKSYNTTIMHIDGGNNRVGIGITSPASTLHLDASGGAVIRLQRTSSNVNNKLELSHDGTDGTITSTNDLILTATNVGIGDTSPFAKLHVEDTGWSSGAPYGTVAYIQGGATNDANWGHLLLSQSGTTTDTGGRLAFGANGENPIAGIRAKYKGATYGDLAFSTRPSGGTNTERMVIDSSGNVKIGDAATDITSKLTVSGNASSDVATFMYDGAAGTYFDIDCGAANNTVTLRADARSGSFPPLAFTTGGSERMRIHSSGKLTVGSTPSQSNGVIEANYTGNAFTLWLTTTAQNYLGFESTESGGQAWSFRTAGTGTYGSANGDLLFVNGTGGIFMRFDQSAGTVEGDFNDTSDIGLKKNIKDTTDGLAELLKLKARKFDWKDKDKRNNVNGFIAQEVETVLPDEVVGDDYDEKKPEHGNKSINTSGLLAVAVKAIQEQQEQIETLKKEVEELKGG